MKKFEYKIVVGTENLVKETDESWLNSGGEEGWELVAISEIKHAREDGIFGGSRRIYYFKREKEE